MSPVDLLVFGPHPDDLEIGMAATVHRHVQLGARVGLCDLTRGELGSNGTPEERVREAEAARAVLGATWRINLALPDGGLTTVREHVVPVVELVRAARPAVIAVNTAPDRHPDHVAAHALLTRAIFDAGLRRFEARGEPWRPQQTCEYFINDSTTPSFVVDVSPVYDTKRAALACYRTQFAPAATDAVDTRLTSPLFARLIESRDAQFGATAGVAYAEGFVLRGPARLAHLFASFAADLPRATEPPA